MLKKRLGIEAIEKVNWDYDFIYNYYRIPPILIIPEGCRVVGDYAFYRCEGLKEVIISDKVEEIGTEAFEWCKNLKKVVIPKSIERVGYRAFRNCKNATIILKKPEKDLLYIGNCAFNGCKDVKEEIRD